MDVETGAELWVNRVLEALDRAHSGASGAADRPFVTLAYAQSVDGSIAQRSGERFRLSGPEALRMTHALRGRHDAILVGVGTVLADDPELSVRLVEARSPQPIIVDSRLRTPPSAKLVGRRDRRPWIATATTTASAVETAAAPVARGDDLGVRRGRAATLERLGARLLVGPSLADGWVDLPALLRSLKGEGVDRLMVEGGAQIISSFLSARLVDYAVVTVAPFFLGGLSVLSCRPGAAPPIGPRPAALFAAGLPSLNAWVSDRLGEDLILAGALQWNG